MSDPHEQGSVLGQLIQLLKVPVLPEGSFRTTSNHNFGPPDKDATVLKEEFRQLVIATNPLKQSNAVPQVIETENIQLFRKKCAGDISQDGDRIQHLQLRINALLGEIRSAQIRRRYIQNLSDYFKPICSPVRRIPPEILMNIFHFCVSADAGPYGGAPLVLCHVSSLWRSVALEFPRLWNRLSLDFGRTSATKYNEISRFWLPYSKNQPRSLRYCHENYHETQPGPQEAFTDIATSSRLLRTLSCLDFDPDLLLSFLRLPSSEVPLLEVVRLVSATDSDDVIETTVFEAAPRLRIVHLEMCTPLFMGTLPWSQLTWLKIQDTINITHWAVAIQQCVQLQYGNFCVQGILLDTFDSENYTVTLEHLETLFLFIGDAWDWFENIFRNFNLPGLRHLSITNLYHEISPAMSFFDMTPCPNLSSLCFQKIFLDQGAATSVFTPTLRRLALDISSLDYLSIVSLLDQSQAMLPNLSYLCLVVKYGDVISDPDTICSAITSRFYDDSSIEHIAIYLWRDEETDVDEDLRSITAAEMDNIFSTVKNHPQFQGTLLGIRVVLETPKLADIVEGLWFESPHDD